MALFETGGCGTWAWFGELDGSGWLSRYTLTVSASYAGCAAMGQEVGQTEQTGEEDTMVMGVVGCGTCTMGVVVGGCYG